MANTFFYQSGHVLFQGGVVFFADEDDCCCEGIGSTSIDCGFCTWSYDATSEMWVELSSDCNEGFPECDFCGDQPVDPPEDPEDEELFDSPCIFTPLP